MSIIQKKLLGLQRKYSLSASDLAVLLESNRSTVVTWLEGKKPHSTKVPRLEEKIAAIAAAGKLFPVPLSVTQFQRKSYLLDAVNGRASKLPKSGSSSGR